MQYVIKAFDADDAYQRRLEVRDQHIELGNKLHAEGKILYGVAMLNDDDQMIGSVYICDFESEKEIQEYLQIEPYFVSGVWEDIEIIPCKVGPTFCNE